MVPAISEAAESISKRAAVFGNDSPLGRVKGAQLRLRMLDQCCRLVQTCSQNLTVGAAKVVPMHHFSLSAAILPNGLNRSLGMIVSLRF